MLYTQYAKVLPVNEVQRKLADLEEKGWTLAAIARELGVSYNAVQKWKAGDRQPANYHVVLERLEGVCRRKRAPKKRFTAGA